VKQTARGTTAFYDINTPVTLARLAANDFEYLSPELIPGYDLYLSFTGGPVLRRIEREFGAPVALPLYCSCEPDLYRPEVTEPRWDLGYLGTYSADRQPALEKLLIEPARAWRRGRFAVAGPQYPGDICWGANVERIDHLSPPEHRGFYTAQRFTLNVTRAEMVRTGYSPSVRLFEAAACGVPVVSDIWEGVETFFSPGREILLARSAKEVLARLRELSEAERVAIGARARARVLAEHTAGHRAETLVEYARRPKRRMNAHG
jgi:spore maturation protein CgeB